MTVLHGSIRVSPQKTPCPVCQGTESFFYAEVEDRLFGLVPGEFRLVRCLSCASVFQDPMPPTPRIASFYPDGYWWDGNGQAHARTAQWLLKLESVYREFVSRGHVCFLCRCARERPPGRRRLLDIGCGSGTILTLARAAGFDTFGMDTSEAAVAAARRNYGLEVQQGAVGDPVWSEERFDFITMFHVLEHLLDPAAALDYAASLLRPGGSLIIQVPNVESIQSRVFGPRWYGLDPPRHLVNFSPQGLRSVLVRSGFSATRQARFSLRDNPASIASSLAPGLDPIGRRGRGAGGGIGAVAGEFLYLALFLVSVPLAWIESWMGFGGTIWVEAKRTVDIEAAGTS